MKFRAGDKVLTKFGTKGIVCASYDHDKYVVRCAGEDICFSECHLEMQPVIDWQYVIDGGFDIVNMHSGGISKPFKHFNTNNFTIRQEVGHVQPHFGGGKPDHINDNDVVIAFYENGKWSIKLEAKLIDWSHATKFIVLEKNND